MSDAKVRVIVRLYKEATGQWFGEVTVDHLLTNLAPIMGPYADDKKTATAKALRLAADVLEER